MARRASLLLLASALAACGRSEASRPSPSAAPVAAPSLAPSPSPAAPAPIAGVATAAATTAAASSAPTATARAGSEPKRARAGSADLKVKRLVLAQGVSGREPVDAATSFRVGEVDRIYAFVEVENAARQPSQVTVTFEPSGRGDATGHVTLDVGGAPRWRTWAYTRAATRPGEWTAIVRSETGEVLASAPFEVTL